MHEKDHEMGGLGEGERKVLAALAALERPVVTVDDVLGRFDMSRNHANLTLSRLGRKGWLRRLRRGAYTVVPLASQTAHPTVEDPRAAAMALFSPCYISGWTAAEHWGLTEQISNTIVVYSAKPQRQSELKMGGVKYRVRRVPEDMIFGTTRVWSGTTPVDMATAHRVIVDVLDAPEMGGGGRQTLDIVREYWTSSVPEPDALLALARRVGRGSVFKRMGFTAERYGNPNRTWLAECRAQLSAGIALLDPAGPRKGPIVSDWHLRINVPLEDHG
ncbi:MAG: type IV toxin-antitoxin system AbiEi family antitoxin domain-containing protein [Gemmatimonadota bacterium]